MQASSENYFGTVHADSITVLPKRWWILSKATKITVRWMANFSWKQDKSYTPATRLNT